MDYDLFLLIDHNFSSSFKICSKHNNKIFSEIIRLTQVSANNPLTTKSQWIKISLNFTGLQDLTYY